MADLENEEEDHAVRHLRWRYSMVNIKICKSQNARIVYHFCENSRHFIILSLVNVRRQTIKEHFNSYMDILSDMIF